MVDDYILILGYFLHILGHNFSTAFIGAVRLAYCTPGCYPVFIKSLLNTIVIVDSNITELIH